VFSMTNVKLDCTGLNCPVPIVRISQAIKKMEAGQTLEVTADDPAFSADVDAWIAKMGHELVALDAGAVQRAVIRKV
jgi:tRNA 2-thiouridine synthesizing protein A